MRLLAGSKSMKPTKVAATEELSFLSSPALCFIFKLPSVLARTMPSLTDTTVAFIVCWSVRLVDKSLFSVGGKKSLSKLAATPMSISQEVPILASVVGRHFVHSARSRTIQSSDGNRLHDPPAGNHRAVR